MWVAVHKAWRAGLVYRLNPVQVETGVVVEPIMSVIDPTIGVVILKSLVLSVKWV